MRDVIMGSPAPNDGAAVYVVEGVGVNLCGSADKLNLAAFLTITAINAHIRTVTEISPQSPCNGTIWAVQDWKNVLFELVTNVENSTSDTDAGAYWGGVMLNEENLFWVTNGTPATPGSASAYRELNEFAENLMLTTPGMSWYYSESFTCATVCGGSAPWSQSDFTLVTANSVPAPEVANSTMVSIINAYTAAFNRPLLATWSLNGDYDLGSLYQAEYFISGEPYHPAEWGLYLSNCFTTGVEACNDWDADGAINNSDNCMSVPNPGQVNADNEIDNGPGVVRADTTIANAAGDDEGDACETDGDIDNDGLPDAQDTEPLGAGICAAFAGSSDGHPNPAGGDITNDDNGNGVPAPGMGSDAADNGPSWDTDGDGSLDGYECAYGSNPRDRFSKPPSLASPIPPGGYPDADGDGLPDNWENRGWGTKDGMQDTDGDGLKDCKEVADVDGNGLVNSTGDFIYYANAVFNYTGVTMDFDLDKNGRVNSTSDFLQIARWVFASELYPCL